MDLKALGESLGLEEDEFLEIVEIFLESAVSDITKLTDALEKDNSEAASEAAHSLKGSSGNLGFSNISDLASSIENKARNSDITNLASAIPDLESMVDAIKTQVNG